MSLGLVLSCLKVVLVLFSIGVFRILGGYYRPKQYKIVNAVVKFYYTVFPSRRFRCILVALFFCFVKVDLTLCRLLFIVFYCRVIGGV